MFLLNSLNGLVHYGVILVQEVILLAGLPSLGGVSFVPVYKQILFFQHLGLEVCIPKERFCFPLASVIQETRIITYQTKNH